MNQDQETILLTLALKKGLLNEKDLQNAKGQENAGQRVDWLVKQGRLDRSTIDLLLNSGEFKAEALAAFSRRNFNRKLSRTRCASLPCIKLGSI